MFVIRVVWCALLVSGCDWAFGFDIPVDAIDAPDAPLPPQSWIAVDGGVVHTCAIRQDRTLWCWGRNDDGQLGLGDVQGNRERPEPAQVGSASDWDTLAAGYETTCAIKLDRSLWCWGRNHNGQVGDGTMETRFEPVQVAGAYTAVAIGRDHTCAIDEAQALHCWGQGAHGRRGDGTLATVLSPTPVAGARSWVEVDVGDNFTCAREAMFHTLWCWGSNANGRLGLGDPQLPDQLVPAQVGTETWSALSVGMDAACGVVTGGKLRCWGSNVVGQLGDGTTMSRAAPNPVDQDQVTDWTSIALGDHHACAIRAAGELACWGDNRRGQLASDPGRTSRPIPTEPSPSSGADARWVSLGLGTQHMCAIDALGRLWCAGEATNGALGTGEGVRRTPAVIAGSWQAPVAGEDATCAFVRGEQALSCWGSNQFGLLGDGTNLDRQEPGPASTMLWTEVDLGDHGCAIDPLMRRWCWGPNHLGQLGDGTTVSTRMPIVGAGMMWDQIAASRSHTCAITTADSLSCWGRNAERQTGRATAVGDNSPTLSPHLLAGTWKQVATGIDFTCGLATDGKAYCWGYAGWGALGTPAATMTTATPLAVATSLSFDALVSGARHSCALAGADAWCWGRNTWGQVGDGSVVTPPMPVQVAGAWRAMSLGEEHSCGIQMDGSLWCWGRNNFGQLGDGSILDRIDPTRIGTDVDWERVALGLRHTCATKTDGRLLCWGGNHGGAIGDGLAWRGQLRLVER